VEQEGAMLEVVAPKVGGVEASDGSWIDADEKIDGGPSVLYDAVALLPSEAHAEMLSKMAPARDFVADAFAHMKFIGFVEAARPLFEKAGVDDSRDDGFIALQGAEGCSRFVSACHQLRFWDREAVVMQV
jgi:catalase